MNIENKSEPIAVSNLHQGEQQAVLTYINGLLKTEKPEPFILAQLFILYDGIMYRSPNNGAYVRLGSRSATDILATSQQDSLDMGQYEG